MTLLAGDADVAAHPELWTDAVDDVGFNAARQAYQARIQAEAIEREVALG